LKTSFAVARNNLAFFERASAAPDFFNDANLGMWDVNNPEQPWQTKEQNNQRGCAANRIPGRRGEIYK
jgi:hypothetical protein